MMAWVFWISAALVVYVYAGYPLLLELWARVRCRPVRRLPLDADDWPFISIIVAARNEAPRLADRVRNLIAQEYAGRREIIVVSDGSVDDPATALAPFADAVRLIQLTPGGKPRALNTGVAAARGEILVFADARQRFAPGSIRELVRNFADPTVGGATGELVLDCERPDAGSQSDLADGVGAYWRYEKWMRRNESRVWSTLGATGAIYALRRSAWRPLPESSLLDDVLAPMRAVLDGWRIVFEDGAIAYDRAVDAAVEQRRKTRTLAGNYQILGLEPRLLLPVVNPVWLQYVSHKFGRIAVSWALLLLLITNILLAPAGSVYLALLVCQLLFYGLAAAGAVLQVRERPSQIAFAFVMMNYAALAGLAALRHGRGVWR